MSGFDADRFVAIIGALAALVIVVSAARSRGVSMRSGMAMLAVWGLVIVLTAIAFAVLGH